MRIVLQRVSEAAVKIEGKIHGEIGSGLLILLGIEAEDTSEDIDWLLGKVMQMRIFSDKDGKMNESLLDQEGEMLIISQFTLHASTKKGNRPSFIKAARPELAIPLYKAFIAKAEKEIPGKVQTGVFGADMKVSLINDGPVTICLDSKNKE
ncbi:MAG: D-aminoacyl-tRNA deacylase [Crocinitomicaceae bacterium]